MRTNPRRWLTRKQLAEYLTCDEVTVWRHSKNGRLPAPTKLGNGFVRYDIVKVDAMLEDSYE